MWQIATGQEYRAALTITNAQSPDAADKCHSSPPVDAGWVRGVGRPCNGRGPRGGGCGGLRFALSHGQIAHLGEYGLVCIPTLRFSRDLGRGRGRCAEVVAQRY